MHLFIITCITSLAILPYCPSVYALLQWKDFHQHNALLRSTVSLWLLASSGYRGHAQVSFEPTNQPSFRQESLNSMDFSTVLKKNERRYAIHLVLTIQRFVPINIHPYDFELALELSCNFLYYWGNGLARITPVGMEIDERWQGRSEHLFLESLVLNLHELGHDETPSLVNHCTLHN